MTLSQNRILVVSILTMIVSRIQDPTRVDQTQTQVVAMVRIPAIRFH